MERITSSQRKLGEWKRTRVMDIAAREICGEPFTLPAFCRAWAQVADAIEAGEKDAGMRTRAVSRCCTPLFGTRDTYLK